MDGSNAQKYYIRDCENDYRAKGKRIEMSKGNVIELKSPWYRIAGINRRSQAEGFRDLKVNDRIMIVIANENSIYHEKTQRGYTPEAIIFKLMPDGYSDVISRKTLRKLWPILDAFKLDLEPCNEDGSFGLYMK